MTDSAFLAAPDLIGEPLNAALAAVDSALVVFAAAGAVRAEPAALQPAGPFLDLYGEPARARAFVMADPRLGELSLRYDYTLPLASMHLNAGAEAARYCYAGPVFRRPPAGEQRSAQHIQVGIEAFHSVADDPAAVDAEVFDLTRQAVGEAASATVIGDVGLLFALIDAVSMPDRWKARLKRHLWRPEIFRSLVEGYARPDDAARGDALLAALAALPPTETEAAAGRILDLAGFPQQGTRTLADVAARLRGRAEDAAARPLPTEIAGLFSAALAVRETAPAAHSRLTDLTKAAGLDAGTALDRYARRLDALAARGVAVDDLAFDAEFGREMEYYDGFVFELRAANGVPVAGGGRYDSLLSALGAANLAGVGAMIRPERLSALQEAQT